jgi:hypothetical protein
MSINNFRQALSHIPGGANMTMRYGNGGRTQIFQIGEDEVEVGLTHRLGHRSRAD